MLGEWDTHHAFMAANQKLLDEMRELEDRARRRDLLGDDDVLFQFYDDRIPRTIAIVVDTGSSTCRCPTKTPRVRSPTAATSRRKPRSEPTWRVRWRD